MLPKKPLYDIAQNVNGPSAHDLVLLIFLQEKILQTKLAKNDATKHDLAWRMQW